MPYCNAHCLIRRTRGACSGQGCLIQAAQRGEPQASDALFALVSGIVLRQARGLCRNSDHAQDLAQTALVQIFRNLHQLHEPEKLLPWVRKIVVNTQRMALRRTGSIRFEELPANVQTSAPAPGQTMDTRRVLNLVIQGIADLPPLLRRTFDCRVVRGLTTRETALELGASEEAVRTRLGRARKRLRDILEDGCRCAALFCALAAIPLIAGEPRFLPASDCALCHARLTSAGGAAIGQHPLWSQSMMAHAAQDPYWKARVAFEVQQAARPKAEVEDLCLRCHAPAQQFALRSQGQRLTLDALDGLGRDGVNCTVCHQITPQALGLSQSFTGGFTVLGLGRIFGPHERPFQMPMQHHTGFTPEYSAHVLESALCGTCHTVVIEHGGGKVVEQGPYLEWLASSHPAAGRTCQSCHMPRTPQPNYIAHRPPGGPFPPTSPRTPFGLHEFAGGNAALAEVLGQGDAARRAMLQQEAALSLHLTAGRAQGRLSARVEIRNLAGHKLPTGFPGRRMWIRLTVSTPSGQVLFDSGGGEPGAQPHHSVIRQAAQVQVYEAVAVDDQGQETLSLLKAARHSKDNRILPAGFRPERFPELDIAPQGTRSDAGFVPGSSTTLYELALPPGELRVRAQVYFQTVNPAHARMLESSLATRITRARVVAEKQIQVSAAGG
ncbi:MAG: sigma-70 family RNA polymerase sigma factor [Acidobacteria bacterium]|nr:sigma-70 family RNA polymerase sigma factor [Acidobacteriota bacterium]